MKEGLASRRDLETWYSIDDVQQENFALDAWYAAEKRAAERKR